jgi:hypothetical protein
MQIVAAAHAFVSLRAVQRQVVRAAGVAGSRPPVFGSRRAIFCPRMGSSGPLIGAFFFARMGTTHAFVRSPIWPRSAHRETSKHPELVRH